jgi:hypothetical protein
VDRTFIHSFEPAAQNPVAGPTVALSTQEIEDAGIREVLQTPGAGLGSWSVLNALLQPTGAGTPFVFREPLGQAREVKVALSGLFGRFVARAYLERYFGLSIFAHLARSTIHLNRRRRIRIEKRHGERGDLPDWISCSADMNALTVAEAKGCHDRLGPTQTLARAWRQAGRVNVYAGNHPVIPLKRIAIVTRWGAARGGAPEPMLAVHDPDDEGDETSPEDMDALFVGLLRLHLAGLLAPLGHPELASELSGLASASFAFSETQASAQARRALEDVPVREIRPGASEDAIDGLVGGLVTRAGPARTASLSEADQEALARLDLRPTFVGIERDVLRLAISGDPAEIRKATAGVSRMSAVARPDRAGGWIVPLGPDLGTLRDA